MALRETPGIRTVTLTEHYVEVTEAPPIGEEIDVSMELLVNGNIAYSHGRISFGSLVFKAVRFEQRHGGVMVFEREM